MKENDVLGNAMSCGQDVRVVDQRTTAELAIVVQ